MNREDMRRAKLQMLDLLDERIEMTEARHVEQVACLRGLIARGESVTEAMRVLVEIEDELVALNERWVSLSIADPE